MSCYTVQAILELLGSSDISTSASQVGGTTGVSGVLLLLVHSCGFLKPLELYVIAVACLILWYSLESTFAFPVILSYQLCRDHFSILFGIHKSLLREVQLELTFADELSHRVGYLWSICLDCSALRWTDGY